MREYEGNRVEAGQLEVSDFNKSKLPLKAINKIETEAEKCVIQEEQIKQLKDNLQAELKQPFIRFGNAVGLMLFLLMFVAPTIVFWLLKLKVVALITATLTSGLFVLLFILDCQQRNITKKKLLALQTDDYQAYRFIKPTKYWCFISAAEQLEEQDHQASDEEGNLYDFYLECAGLVFPLSEREYESVNDSFIFILFKLEKNTAWEYLIS